MAKRWQIRRGTTAQNEGFTGALAEVTYDTEKKTVRVHDGVTAGGTELATNDNIQTLLNSIYNVGSIYIGTQSVCPMIALIPNSTWESVGTSIVTSVDSSASVKGNGKVLGLTNGTTTYALNSGVTYARLTIGENAGQDVSASDGYDTGIPGSYKLGVTTDSSKSGLTADITKSTISVNIWKRTA